MKNKREQAIPAKKVMQGDSHGKGFQRCSKGGSKRNDANTREY